MKMVFQFLLLSAFHVVMCVSPTERDDTLP